MDAALALLDASDASEASAGPDAGALTLRGIARSANISPPSIYAHFDDLPALVEVIRARCFEGLRLQLADAVERSPSGDPVAALIAAGRAYVRFGRGHRARYRLMFAAEGYAANAIETFALVESLVVACAEAGIGRSENPRADTWMVWAGLHGVVTLDKPSRASMLRLGPLDRPGMLDAMIRRLARVEQ